jgi:hypothetical protein
MKDNLHPASHTKRSRGIGGAALIPVVNDLNLPESRESDHQKREGHPPASGDP